MGTNIHEVLLFAWVLLFRKPVVTAVIGTNIHGVLVIDGYLYSRVYGRTGTAKLKLNKSNMSTTSTCKFIVVAV